MKTTKELLDAYELGKYDELSTEELERLKVLIQLNAENGSKKADVNFATDVSLSKDTTAYSSDYQWIVDAGTKPYEYTDSDAACPQSYDSWTPSEWFSNYIIHAAVADTPLLQIVKMKVDLGAGNGDTVKFRTISARTAQGGLAGCELMSCASNTISTHDVTIGRFGDYSIICEFDDWQSKDVKRSVVESMAKGAARYINSEIHDAITEATPVYDEDMAAVFTLDTAVSGSCCTNSDGYNLYVACVDLAASMKANGYDVDKHGVWLMSPSVAALLKYPSGVDVPAWMLGSTEMKDGKLVKLLGIPVIEDPLGQTAVTNASTVFAYLIDTSQAIGLAWGRKPSFTEVYDGQSDSWKIAYNAYFGVDSIIDAAIGTVSSP